MILIVDLALMFAILAPVVGRGNAAVLSNAALLAVLASPWVLTLLILVFDRPGPIKFWAAPLVLFSFSPLLALCYDGVILMNYLNHQVRPNLVVGLVVNGLFIGSFVVYVINMGPVACPGCGRTSLIPWMTLWGRVRRFSKTRWCACCGAKYWRNPGESWKPEKRRS
jgi:hypothetical protein